jgi:hypothetical protein
VSGSFFDLGAASHNHHPIPLQYHCPYPWPAVGGCHPEEGSCAHNAYGSWQQLGLWLVGHSIRQQNVVCCLMSLPPIPSSNNPSFHLKQPRVPDNSDGSDRTSYHLRENYTLPVAQVTGRVAYTPPLICVWYTHYQNNRCVTLFTGDADML